MISVMNRDFELEKNSGGNEESRAEQMVLEYAVGSSNLEVSNSRVSDEARASLMELDPGAPESESGAKMLGNARSAEFRVSASEEVRFQVSSNGEGMGVEMKGDGSVGDNENPAADRFDGQVGQFDASNDRKHTSPQFKSLLSEFDEYVANEKSGAMIAAATSRAMSYGFEVGDMVWGKVKSHPWWPGHIFNDALVSPSVRRTRRDGYVLVAFFGDSSYGWFDPAELIPFDPNYYEKSRQTSSRTFLKAVEEAVDEANRRRGLGLACKCRNHKNFSPTNVEGYVAVDIPDFEVGCTYSWNQIRRSRDSFKPGETLSFIKQLALTPRGGDHRSINFLNNKATIFAYRKAVYEEFDETYAQAFGVPPGRHAREVVSSFDQLREPARAPLSGPLVIAEALGGGKSTIKPMKLKDQSKKDRYLFKRRDELSDLKDVEIHQELSSSAVPGSLMGRSTESGSGEDYVLLKRTPTVPIKTHVLEKSENTRFMGGDSEVFSLHMPIFEAELGQLPTNTNIVSQGHSIGVEGSSDKGNVPLGEVKVTVAFGEASNNDMPRERAFPSRMDSESLHDRAAYATGEVRSAETANISNSYQQPELSDSVNLESDPEMDPAPEIPVVPEPLSVGAKYSDGDISIGGVMKPKVLKRPAEDLSSGGVSFIGEKKKKKKKRDAGAETSSDHFQKQLVSKKVASLEAKLAGKFSEEFRLEHQKKVFASHSGMLAVSGKRNDGFDVPQLLSDFKAIALDPFHGVEWNCDVVVQKFFLRFRSLVYMKSLALSPPSEAESFEPRAGKSPDTDNVIEHGQDLPSSNLAKPLLRRDDPTKAGRKRVPSDRLEEIAAKKMKKISDLKLLTSEKKATLKLSDTQRRESRESALPTLGKPAVKRDAVKKLEPSVKKVDPTMLVLRFPPQTALPSLNELKARFGRFGPIDQSGLRVFWKSSTCRVVFLHKPDAQAAYRYAVGNKSLFGNVNVNYHLREVATEASETDKPGGEDNPSNALRPKDPMTLQGRVSVPTHQPLPGVQLKSCLKKTPADEGGGTSGGGSSKGTARVKFMLGGEESSIKGEQLMMMIGNRNNNINANFADGGTLLSSSSSFPGSLPVGMDINSNFFQKVAPPPPPPPLLPLPTQFTKPPLSLSTNLHHLEKPSPPPPPLSLSTAAAAAAATTTDISHQMLTLLTRCSDVVTNVTGLLGYVPYHPL